MGRRTRFSGRVTRSTPYRLNAVKLAATAFRAWQGRTKTQMASRQNAAPAPITGESDYRGVYKKRRMPARKRKNWVKFTKKVSAVLSAKLNTQCYVVVLGGESTAAANKQNVIWNSLYGCNGDQYTDDVRRLCERVNGSGVQTADLNRRIVCTGALFELSLVNVTPSGTATAQAPPVATEVVAGTAYIDCYYWRCSRDCPNAGSANPGGYGVGNVTDLFTAGLAQLTSTAPVGGSPLDILDYGVTPFQSPVFSRFCQVWKKTRIKLAPGGTAQLELRDAKNHWMNWQYHSNKTLDKTMTQGIFIIVYGVPSAGTNTIATPVRVRWSLNKNYSYKVLERSLSGGSTNVA